MNYASVTKPQRDQQRYLAGDLDLAAGEAADFSEMGQFGGGPAAARSLRANVLQFQNMRANSVAAAHVHVDRLPAPCRGEHAHPKAENLPSCPECCTQIPTAFRPAPSLFKVDRPLESPPDPFWGRAGSGSQTGVGVARRFAPTWVVGDLISTDVGIVLALH